MSESFRLVVTGDGVAGALAAAVLSVRLPAHSHRIVLVPTRTPPDDMFGRIEPSLPSIRRFHADHGLNEQDVIRSGASFSLGIAYSGWSKCRATYFLPFGDTGAALGGVAFHQHAARLRSLGQRVALNDYSVAALLAQAGRFAHPANDPRTPLSTYTYALHLDVASYASFLLERARRQGVATAHAPLAGVALAGDGSVAAVRLEDGSAVEGDLFIDATGSAARLIGAIPGARRESWRRWFPHDRSVEILSTTPVSAAPYAHAAAVDGGWTRVVPGGGGVSQLAVYSSEALVDEEAERRLRGTIVGREHGPVVHRVLEPGRQAEPWLRNCVALGAAAAQLEPLAGTAMQLIQSGVERLLRLFPRSRVCEIEAREYVRAQTLESDRCRDFALLPSRLSGRLAEGPPELEQKIELFRSRGRVPLLDGDLFEEQDWATVFDGHGVEQRRHDLLADAIPLPRLQAQLARMRQVMIHAVAGVPSHAHGLQQIQHEATA